MFIPGSYSPDWDVLAYGGSATGGGGGITDPPVDGITYGRHNAAWNPVLPIAGGTVTGPITLAADPANPLEAATKQYVDAKPSGGIPEAPTDGALYGRQSAAWAVVPAATGGTSARVFNALGNPSFEVTQRNCGALLTNPSFVEDRWQLQVSGPFTLQAQVMNAGLGAGGGILVPGSNYTISRSFLRVTNQVIHSPLATGDFVQIIQYCEGSVLRELINDVHSVSILYRCSVGNQKFCLAMRDAGSSQSLIKFVTAPATANTWSVITLPNLPVFPGAGTFSIAPGNVGYYLSLCLAAGTTYQAPATDIWQNGNFIGVAGQSNIGAAVGTTYDFAFIVHEPGAVCNPLQAHDIDFDANYDRCLRYFQKSYEYGVTPGPGGDHYQGCAVLHPHASYPEAFGEVTFKKTMAKVPTLTPYHVSGGAVNQGLVLYGASYAISGFPWTTDKGFSVVSTSANFAASEAGLWFLFHWKADTGW
jgi:hypothetical protein